MRFICIDKSSTSNVTTCVTVVTCVSYKTVNRLSRYNLCTVCVFYRPTCLKVPITNTIPSLWFPLLSYSCCYCPIGKASVWRWVHNNPLHSIYPPFSPCSILLHVWKAVKTGFNAFASSHSASPHTTRADHCRFRTISGQIRATSVYLPTKTTGGKLTSARKNSEHARAPCCIQTY